MLGAATRDLVIEAEFREQKGAGWKKKNSKMVLCEWKKKMGSICLPPFLHICLFYISKSSKKICARV